MKKLLIKLIPAIFFVNISTGIDAQVNLVINGGIINISNAVVLAIGNSENKSDILDVRISDKGFLLPMMSTAQRAAIASPVLGLKVFDTDIKSIWFYNGGDQIRLLKTE